MTRSSTIGPQPTRGVALGGPPNPNAAPRIGGFTFMVAALPAAFSLAHSTFFNESMSFGCSPSSFISCLVSSRDCSAVGGLPPPPDCTDAR